MKVIFGSGHTPVVYSVHHASHDFGEFTDRVKLNDEQKLRFSDYGSSETVPENGIVTLIAETSRGLVDLNRPLDSPNLFPEKDFSKPNSLDIWKKGQKPTESEKKDIIKSIYEQYHKQLIESIKCTYSKTVFVVSWDNTAHYEIGKNEQGNSVIMPSIILSNNGDEGSPDLKNNQTTCDPKFLELLAANLRKELSARSLPDDVYLNLVFKGGAITKKYNSYYNKYMLAKQGITNQVQSLQVEYSTAITQNQETLAPIDDNIKRLKSAFESAMEKSCREYLSN